MKNQMTENVISANLFPAARGLLNLMQWMLDGTEDTRPNMNSKYILAALGIVDDWLNSGDTSELGDALQTLRAYSAIPDAFLYTGDMWRGLRVDGTLQAENPERWTSYTTCLPLAISFSGAEPFPFKPDNLQLSGSNWIVHATGLAFDFSKFYQGLVDGHFMIPISAGESEEEKLAPLALLRECHRFEISDTKDAGRLTQLHPEAEPLLFSGLKVYHDGELNQTFNCCLPRTSLWQWLIPYVPKRELFEHYTVEGTYPYWKISAKGSHWSFECTPIFQRHSQEEFTAPTTNF